MPIQVWETLEYGWINIVVVAIFLIIFLVYALFKLRKNYLKKYLIHLLIGSIMTILIVSIVNLTSPRVNNMYYKYENNMEVIWLTQSGWEIVEHYGNKKIVHVRGG